MGRLWHGTSSWSAKGWAGVFYPAGLPPAQWLSHYATQFPCVEADVTYYRVPDARLVSGWVAKTPAGFRIAAKFPRSVVHAGRDRRPDPRRLLVPSEVRADVRAFLDAMGLLGERAGPLLLQFPFLGRDAFEGVEPFAERLDRFLGLLPPDFRYAVEVRNRGWIRAPLLDVLRRHRAALVWVELGWLPHPADWVERRDAWTGDFAYARLIGDRKATEARTRTFDSTVLDRSDSLERWARIVAASLERVPETYVFANNHYAGYAPDTIRELIRRLPGDMRGDDARGAPPGTG